MSPVQGTQSLLVVRMTLTAARCRSEGWRAVTPLSARGWQPGRVCL